MWLCIMLELGILSFTRREKEIQDGREGARIVWVQIFKIAQCLLFIHVSLQNHSLLGPHHHIPHPVLTLAYW